MEFMNSQVLLGAASRAPPALPVRQPSSWAASRLTCPNSILGTLWQDAFFLCTVRQLLDTFVSLMKGIRMPGLLPPGNFFTSQGLPSGHKNY